MKWPEFFESEDPAPKEKASFWTLFEHEDKSQEEGEGEGAESATRKPSCVHFDERFIYWAFRNLDSDIATKHLVACGVIGAGKTVAIRLYLQSIAPRFLLNAPDAQQLITFDGKTEILPILASLGHHPNNKNVWLINPYDERGAVWNVAEAAESPLLARHLAALLVTEEKNSNSPFWWTAARELVYSVVLALNEVSPKTWSLRDLLCGLESATNIQALTKREPRAKAISERILGDGLHSPGVVSTLATKLGQFEQIAALWHTSPRRRHKFSVTEFLKKPGVLVLGNDPALRESLWPINAMIIKALTHEILRKTGEVRKPKHWFVLDEFHAMEKVDAIKDLLNRGRSKGASVLLGIQGVEGLFAIYEKHGGNDILEQCAVKTFFRLGGPETGEWAEKLFGKYREMEGVVSENFGKQSGGTGSTQYTVHERSLLTAAFFMNLPMPKHGGDYKAVHDLPDLETVLITERDFSAEFSRVTPAAKEEEVPAVIPRTDPNEQKFFPWSEDEKRCFLGPPEDAANGAPESPKSGEPDLPPNPKAREKDEP